MYQLVYTSLNILMLSVVCVILLMLFRYIDREENKYLFFCAIGLGADILGYFTISYTNTYGEAILVARMNLVGKMLFGIGFIMYIGKVFKAKHSGIMYALWGTVTVAEIIASFFPYSFWAYLKDPYIIKVSGVTLLMGDKTPMHYAHFIVATALCIWSLGAIFFFLKNPQNRHDSRVRTNAIFFFCAVALQVMAAVVYESNYERMADISPLLRGASALVYIALSSRYHLINYSGIAQRTLMDNVGAGVLVLSEKGDVLFANDYAYEIFPDVKVGANAQNIPILCEAVSKHDITFEKDGAVFNVIVDRIINPEKATGYTVLITDVSSVSQLERELEGLRNARENMITNISHEIRTPLNTISGAVEMLEKENLPEKMRSDYVEMIKAAGFNIDDILNDILRSDTVTDGENFDTAPYRVVTLVDNVIDMCIERVAQKKIDFSIYIDKNVPVNAIGDDAKIRQVLLNVFTNAIRYTENGTISLWVLGKALPNDDYEYEYYITDTGKRALGPSSSIDNAYYEGSELGTSFETGYGISLLVAKKLARSVNGDLKVFNLGERGIAYSFKFVSKILNSDTISDENLSKRLCVTLLGGDPDKTGNIIRNFEEYGINVTETSNSRHLEETPDKLNLVIFDNDKYAKRMAGIEGSSNLIKVAILRDRKFPKNAPDDFIYIKRPVSIISIIKVVHELDVKSSGAVSDTENFTTKDARVLIVDDNSLNVEIAISFLNEYNVSCEAATSGYECLNLLKAGNKYDFILMDYMMEGMDGIETTRQVRNLACDASKTVILAFTANNVEGAREKYIAAGMDGVLFKPATISVYAKTLKTYLPKYKIVYEDASGAGKHYWQSSEYPVIEGIDIEAAKLFTAGNAMAYRKMLANFYTESEIREKDIVSFYESQNFQRMEVEAHGIKGVARTLGIISLAEKMERFEHAAEARDEENIYESYHEAIEEYRCYIEKLKPFAAEMSESAEKHEPVDFVEAVLLKMLESLDDFEMEKTEDLFSALWPGDYEGDRQELMENLKNSIDRVDYYASRDYVEQLLETYK